MSYCAVLYYAMSYYYAYAVLWYGLVWHAAWWYAYAAIEKPQIYSNIIIKYVYSG